MTSGGIKTMKIIVSVSWIAAIVCSCHAETPKKVVGGTRASIYSYPYIASILQGDHSICTGAIVTDSLILTTASCLILELFPVKAILSNIKVSTGTNDKFGLIGDGSMHRVSEFIHHEYYYESDFWTNDIAFLKLETPICLSLTRSLSSLTRTFIRSKSLVKVLGFGGSIYLNLISMRAESHKDCKGRYSHFRFNIHLQGCISSIDFDTPMGIVEGDSGDPLIHRRKIYGIVSVMIPGDINNAFFTKIWPYEKWIAKVIFNN